MASGHGAFLQHRAVDASVEDKLGFIAEVASKTDEGLDALILACSEGRYSH
jgi:hypothetical protein